jgi:bifunctional DNase/RNase
MFEMDIDSIRVNLINYQRVVILKEKSAERFLPIWIGPSEAESIAICLQEVSVGRPMTHDLLVDVIKKSGATISAVVISELSNDTFYAKIILERDSEKIDIDSRPSDAIALAVRVRAPIFVDDSVLDKAGVYIDKDSGKPIIPSEEIEPSPDDFNVSEQELENLSAFTEFVEELNLDNLGDNQS